MLDENNFKKLDRLLWFFLSIVALAYVLVAVYASTGRYFFPKLPEYQDNIVALLERKTGFDWEIEGLEGGWQKFDPIIRGAKIRIVDKDQDAVFFMTDFMLRLDVLASLWHLEPRITDFKAGKIQLLLEHTDEGQWIIKNVPTRHSDQQISLESFVSHFREISLEDVDVRVLYSGEIIEMPAVKLAFQRFGEYRRVHFEQSSEEAGDLRLIIESEQSFWDEKGELSVYAKARDLNINRWLAVITDDWHLNQLSGEWWMQREPDRSRWTASALVSNSTLGKSGKEDWLLSSGSVRLAAEQHYGGDLRIWWHELAGVWRDQALDMPEGFLDVQVDQGKLSNLTVNSPRIDLGLLNGMLLGSGLIEGGLSKVLSTLQPKGLLTSLELSLPLNNFPDGFEMSANLDNVSLKPWRNAPGVEGVNGFVTAEKESGVVHLDTQQLALEFPGVYEQPIELGRSVGQVQWRLGSRIKVFSGPIAATFGDETLGARFALNLGKGKQDEASQMTLMIGSRDSDVDRASLYIPTVLDKGLRDWLSDSLQAGELLEGGFIYHGSLRAGQKDRRSVAAYFNVDDASLRFDPEWPVLTSLAGLIEIDDSAVFGRAIDGMLYKTRLSNADIEVSRVSDHLRLGLKIDAKGDVTDGLRLLKETPLASFTGQVIDDWQGHGQVDYRLVLDLPLSSSDAEPERISVKAGIDNGALTLPALNLNFDSITGDVNFTSGIGLHAKDLTAKIWGEFVQVDIGNFGESTHLKRDNNFSMHMKGLVRAEQLLQWSQLPVLTFLRGATQAEVNLSVIEGEAKAAISSDLIGVQIELPDGYFKSAEQAQMIQLEWPIADGPQVLNLEVAEVAHMHFMLEEGSLLGGMVYLGREDQSPSLELGKFIVTGMVNSVNLDAWQNALHKYVDAEEEWSNDTDTVPVFVERLEIQDLSAFGEQFEQSVISAHALAGYWHVEIENQKLQGVISIPDTNKQPLSQRYRINLQYLRLPGRDLISTTESAGDLWSMPEEWVPMEVKVNQLYLGDEPYGSWSFQLTPDDEQVRVHDMLGSLRGMNIRGKEPHAIRWFVDESGQLVTSTSLIVTTENIDEAITAWGYETPVISNETHLQLNMNWLGAPNQFSLAKASGRLDFSFSEGQFLKASNSANNILRAFGLFNFDTIVRRLQFDFSDLYGKGLSFDQATGALISEGHIISLVEPLVVTGPSSSFIMKGYVDVNSDQVDAELVATLPVATSLPWVAALAGGLPAAAGVFVVSKLFQSQVDKLSSAVYSVQGPIDDPVIKFERLFDDSPNDTSSSRPKAIDQK